MNIFHNKNIFFNNFGSDASPPRIRHHITNINVVILIYFVARSHKFGRQNNAGYDSDDYDDNDDDNYGELRNLFFPHICHPFYSGMP